MTSSTWPSGSGSGTTGRSTSRCAVVRSPSRSSHSPYDSVIRPPAGPGRASRTHPLKFCPKSTTKARPPRTGRTATGRISSTRRTGGATERTMTTSTSRATAPSHARSSNDARRAPPACEPAVVLPLAADEVGRGDVGRRHAPARAAARHHLPAGPGPHLELRAQRQVPAVLVRGARQPDLAAVPPVGQQHREHVPPRRHQRRDVVGLVLDPRAVLGVAGGQLDVADALPVQERLVQAEGRDVQPGLAGRGSGEGRPEPVRGPRPLPRAAGPPPRRSTAPTSPRRTAGRPRARPDRSTRSRPGRSTP